MDTSPPTMNHLVRDVREQLVCDRCGRYIGALAETRYRPAPYPVALGPIGPEDEAAALVGFELHMASLLREGKFTIRHPQIDDRCVSMREWMASDDDDDDDGMDDEDEG